MKIGEWNRGCDTNACVEVMLVASGVKVRNSKDPDGPWLNFTADEWTAFLGGAKSGKFDL